MAAKLRIETGTDPAFLTKRLMQEYVAALTAARRQQQCENVLWLTPSSHAQRVLTRQLVQQLGHCCWTPRIETFDSFAEWLLRRAGHSFTPISSTVRRLLLRRLIRELREAGELTYFAAVAETPGFLNAVEAFVVELKRNEIWPEKYLQASQRISASPERDQELGTLYQSYQDVLQQHRWYDSPGRFWLAREELAEGRCDPLSWSYIAVVGFTDFTRTQHAILRLLAERTEQMVITLPWDKHRPDLFAKVSSTLQVLKEEHQPSSLIVEHRPCAPADDESPAFRRFIREGLFSPPGSWRPQRESQGLHIVAALGPQSEQAAVAYRIKHLLAQGVCPEEIVVGLWSLAQEGHVWTQAFQAAGIPVWCEQGPQLREQGLLKFLMAVLTAEAEDWSYHALMRVLDSSFFRPKIPQVDVPSSVRAVAEVLRRLRLPKQREVMLTSVYHAAQRDGHDTEAEADPTLASRARRALPLLQWYSQHTETLRKAHTLSDWIDVLAHLVDCLGCLLSPAAEPGAVSDVLVWDRLQRMLRDAAGADSQRSTTPTALSLPAFMAELRDLLADERLDPPSEARGKVRILSCEQLRHLSVPHVFLVNLVEESFPRRRQDDCLLSDSEREHLAAQCQLPLLHHRQHLQNEMLFFYLLLLSARQSLTISYPAVDSEGQPAYPSPYLTSVSSLFVTEAVEPVREGCLDPLPPPDRALTTTDVRLLAMHAALQGAPGWFRALGEHPPTRCMVQNVLAAVEMAVQRFHTSGFTVYEGRLESPTHLRSLAQRYGSEHHFSATELETYAACPFRFWLEHVIRVSVSQEPTEETDPLRRGHLVHAVLADLLAHYPPGTTPDELTRRFRELVELHLRRQPTLTELQQALTRIERQLLDEWATAYGRQMAEYLDILRQEGVEGLRDSLPEIAFGKAGQSGDNDHVFAPLMLGSGEEAVSLCGRIDRLDLCHHQGRLVYTVIDYKTGKPPKFNRSEVQSGRALQLVLYTLAVQRLGIAPPNAIPFQMGYWCLKETGFRAGLSSSRKKITPVDEAVWHSLVELLEETVPRLATGIRQGEFVVDNPDRECSKTCDFRTICRVNQIRPLAEQLAKLRRFGNESDATHPELL